MREKKRTIPIRSALVLGAGLVAGALPLAAQSNSLRMLNGLAKGEWTIKYRDGSAERKICIKTGQELIQLQHDQPNCSHVVIEDQLGEFTVQYTCPGTGYGRTNVRRETEALVQIESNGISSGLPFQFVAEARRTGSC
ncbi:MAG: hypothetical protein AAGA34_03485 [Pseudomonadota bacterium]